MIGHHWSQSLDLKRHIWLRIVLFAGLERHFLFSGHGQLWNEGVPLSLQSFYFRVIKPLLTSIKAPLTLYIISSEWLDYHNMFVHMPLVMVMPADLLTLPDFLRFFPSILADREIHASNPGKWARPTLRRESKGGRKGVCTTFAPCKESERSERYHPNFFSLFFLLVIQF